MNTQEMTTTLMELVDGEVSEDVRSFQEGGVMTSDEGFTVRVGDDEFQVTVVQSR